MSEEDLLNIDYFLNADKLDVNLGTESFIFSNPRIAVSTSTPHFSIQENSEGMLSYKAKTVLW